MYAVTVYSKAAEGEKPLMENFRVREFACKDGSDMILINLELVELLQRIRTHFRAPVTITSAYRSPCHNKKVGGAKTSQHLYGIAADIQVKGVAPKTVAAYVEQLMSDKGGIGIYPTFVHVDVRKMKSRWRGN